MAIRRTKPSRKTKNDCGCGKSSRVTSPKTRNTNPYDLNNQDHHVKKSVKKNPYDVNFKHDKK